MTNHATPMLSAVVDRIIPRDRSPGGLDVGSLGYVLGKIAGTPVHKQVEAGLQALDEESVHQFGRKFLRLDEAERDQMLVASEQQDWFVRLVELVTEGFYANPENGGNHGAASWIMVGYEHGLPDGPDGPSWREDEAPRDARGVEDAEYDVIIVGAGAGGGSAAFVLAEAGKRVLLIERGVDRHYADSGHRDHLRNHRLPAYGHNTGPDPHHNPRVFVDPDGRERVVHPFEAQYHNNAACVGSGTLVYGGLAWRFHPDDFRMASRYGVPDGSSLADWPFGYEELAPWYDRVEWEVGVSGVGGANPHEGPRNRGYPMPPLPQRESARMLSAGAERLGLNTFPPPLLINSVERHGRSACIECGSCVGFPCPSNAKSGTQNTLIPRAIATGNCRLVTGVVAHRVDTDSAGRVTGVVVRLPGDSGVARLRARAVVLSAGAVETARLLLLSASVQEPSGLGNRHDLVGRNLQGHLYPTAFGLFDTPVHDSLGPGVTIATCDFNHGNPGIVGGAMLADDFVMPPVIFWRQAFPPQRRRWGASAKGFMRDSFRFVGQVKGPVQEIPSPTSRVTLASLRDSWDRPVARLSGVVHEETMRTANFMLERAHDWLRAAGATDTWNQPLTRRLSAGQHQAGTCRTGTDPRTSVTDAFGRVWGHENLFVCDASLHPTNGGSNPVLTIMALAFRNASHVASTI